MIYSTQKIKIILFLLLVFFRIQLVSQSIQWNPEETGYYQIEKGELIFKSTKGKDNIVILSKKDLTPNNSSPLALEGYTFSKDRNQILIFTNTKRIWRYKTKGD